MENTNEELAEEFIIDNYGYHWLEINWKVTDVIDVMAQFLEHELEKSREQWKIQ